MDRFSEELITSTRPDRDEDGVPCYKEFRGEDDECQNCGIDVRARELTHSAELDMQVCAACAAEELVLDEETGCTQAEMAKVTGADLARHVFELAISMNKAYAENLRKGVA